MKKILTFFLALSLMVSCKHEPPGTSESLKENMEGVIAGWEAASADRVQGISLVKEEDANWNIEKHQGIAVAAIVPVDDYQRRAAFVLKTEKAPVRPMWLSVGYLDTGYGLISVSPSVPAIDQWGVARLNTGKIRHAVFRIEPEAFEGSIRIYGLEYLYSVYITESEPTKEPIPDVQPALKLQQPITLVMGSLTDVRNDDPADATARLRNMLPLVKALGFTGIESYVRWNAVEREEGIFDWSYYDGIVEEAKQHGLKWSPFVITGPAYTLPAWFHDSPDFLGFECLEHHQRTDIQTIFSDKWPGYVQRYLAEFGRHYGKSGDLCEMNTGISGCYGEVLYPAGAGANMGYAGRPLHAHAGYWGGGKEACRSFQKWLSVHYQSVNDLNRAWETAFKSFGEIETYHPSAARTARQKLDFLNWYLDSMSDWADRWGEWSKQALPGIPVYHKVGGWEGIDDGADFTRVTRDAARSGVGIRETTEHDNFEFNFGMTRLLSTATRFYGATFAMEPAGLSSARGVVSRLYGAIVNNAGQLFYYTPNLFGNDQAIGKWLRYAPLLDQRSDPLIDIAAFYPSTSNKLDEAGRHLLGPFFSRAYSLRSITDHDFVSEQMILDGALDRYKVLVFLWGDRMEKPVLERIAQWVNDGGTVITPLALQTVEGDNKIMQQWEQGETGKGLVIRFREHEMTPSEYYLRFVHNHLLELNNLNSHVMQALNMEKPETVYWSILKNGQLALLNYNDEPATVRFGKEKIEIEPYGIVLKRLEK